MSQDSNNIISGFNRSDHSVSPPESILATKLF